MTRLLVIGVLAVSACGGGTIGMHPPTVDSGDGGGGFGGGGGSDGGGQQFTDGGGTECFGGGSSSAGVVDSDPVSEPARAPPAISGGTMIVMANNTIVAADPDRDLVWLVVGRAVRQVTLATGAEPGRVVEGPSEHVFVALRHAGTIAEIDTNAGSVVALHEACSAPRGLAWLAPSETLYVACAGGELVNLTFANDVPTATTSQFLAADLRDIVPAAGGLLLTTFRQAHVLRLASNGVLVQTTDDQSFVPTDDEFALGSEGGLDAGFPDDDVDAGPPIDSVAPEPLAFNRSAAWRMIATPTGAVVVHQRAQASQLSAQFDAPCGGSSGVGYGSAGQSLAPVHTTADVVDFNGAVTEAPDILQARSLVLPVDAALSAGGQLAIISAGLSTLEIAPLAGSTSPQTFATQGQPTAVAFMGEQPVVFVREPAAIIFPSLSGQLPDVISLVGVSVASTGHQIFHTATSNVIACASCHPEAGDDAHVWLLPEGARRTPSLRGGLIGTEPFHWSGDEADMPALVTDVLVQRMAGSGQSAERSQALLSWLDQQVVLSAPPTDATKVAAGAALFQTNCTSCHAGVQGTNNTTVDVGTGGTFQVPRLHELWYRAPFMHDGRAATLAERFGPAGGTNHANANIAALSAVELDQLTEYLLSR